MPLDRTQPNSTTRNPNPPYPDLRQGGDGSDSSDVDDSRSDRTIRKFNPGLSRLS